MLKRWQLNFDRRFRTKNSDVYGISIFDQDSVKENNDGSGTTVGTLHVHYSNSDTYAELYLDLASFDDEDLNILNFFINRDIINDYEYELTIYKLDKHVCTLQN